MVRLNGYKVEQQGYKACMGILKLADKYTPERLENACKKAFEQFCQEWSQYPGAVDVWKRNFSHVEQLFDYGSAVRRVMYTTNAVESINSSFRKVTKKGAFPSENALLKVLYLRITELYKKWNGSKIQNWAMVRNQLVTNDKIKARIEKYEHMI